MSLPVEGVCKKIEGVLVGVKIGVGSPSTAFSPSLPAAMYGSFSASGKMPAGLEWDVELQSLEWMSWKDSTFPELEFNNQPSEDFWNKFEELPELGDDLESLLDNETNNPNYLRHHDCMWAGTCQHKPYHQPKKITDPQKQMKNPNKPPDELMDKSPQIKTEPPRPDTPPSQSESEEDKAVCISQITGRVRRVTNTTQQQQITNVTFEHNYQKPVRTDDLGVQTPSDSEDEDSSGKDEEESSSESETDSSEEEIDVVNLPPQRIPRLPPTPTKPKRLTTNKKTPPVKQSRYQLHMKITEHTLLSASRAVSRRLVPNKAKRKRRISDSECEDEHQNYRKKYRSPKKSRLSTDSETDTTEKRSLHNNMERMRRIDLRNAFEDLRCLVPTLEGNNKAPKVIILKDATSYLHELGKKDKTFSSQVSELRHEQERLKRTLSQLRRSLAVTRY